MSHSLDKFGPLRKKWEAAIQKSGFRWRSISEVATEAGVPRAQLTNAINDGVGSEKLRLSLQSIGVPSDLIPLPSCSRTLAGMYFEAQEKLSQSLKM